MALSPEQEWTLVACGLVAHADGIVDDAEWGQVLFLLDERIDEAQLEPWVALLREETRLREHMQTLQPPPPFLAEAILEKAWRIALSDGEGSAAEAAMHDELAERLGVGTDEAASLRRTWTERAAKRAELVAGFAAILARLDGAVVPDEAKQFEALLGRLPLTEQRRNALRELLVDPPDADEIIGGLAALDPEDRHIVVLELVPLVHAAAVTERDHEMFFELAGRLGIARGEAEHMLLRW